MVVAAGAPLPLAYLPLQRIGNVSAFALAVAIAFCVGVRVTLVSARRRGEDTEEWWPLIWRAIVGAVIGARVGHVIGAPTVFLNDPWAALSIGDGGLSLFGAVVGGIVFCRPYLRANGRPMRPVLDAVAPVILLMVGIGRLGQAIAADALGIGSIAGIGYRCPPVATASACAGSFVGAGAGSVVVPTWLLDLVVIAALVGFVRYRWGLVAHPAGTTFLVLAGGYAAARFVCDFTRTGPRLVGLTSGQIAELVILVAVAALWRNWNALARVSRAEAKAQRAVANAEKARARAEAELAKANAVATAASSAAPGAADAGSDTSADAGRDGGADDPGTDVVLADS